MGLDLYIFIFNFRGIEYFYEDSIREVISNHPELFAILFTWAKGQ